MLTFLYTFINNKVMTTILISFVGTQDPYSDKNKKNGSILTLTKYLLDQKEEIKKSILLYTQDLETQAELTKECLQQEFSLLKVELIKVNQLLSIDPINLLMKLKKV